MFVIRVMGRQRKQLTLKRFRMLVSDIRKGPEGACLVYGKLVMYE